MASNQNIDSAARTYTSFVGLMKWGTIAAIILAAIVILLISKGGAAHH